MNIDENKREIYNKTLEHKKDVSERLTRLINAIEERKENHDNSKLNEPEITKFQEFLAKEMQCQQIKKQIEQRNFYMSL